MNSYTINCGLAKPAVGDPGWGVTIAADLDALDALGAIGPLAVSLAETPSTTRNVRVAAGTYRKADGTAVAYAGTAGQALPAGATTYLWLSDAGTLTTGFAWPAATAIVRLAVTTTDAGTVTAIADARAPFASYGASTGGPFLPLAGGTLTGAIVLSGGGLTLGDGFNLAVGTGTGTRVGTATGQKLAFWGSAPVIQPAGAAQAALTDSTTGSTATATLGNAHAATALTDSSGGTASGTLAAAANASALTDSSGGTASTTLAAIADAPTANAVASLAARLAEQRSLNTVLVNAIASLAAKVNALVGDAGTANDNVAKLAKLQGAVRTALVSFGGMKGSA